MTAQEKNGSAEQNNHSILTRLESGIQHATSHDYQDNASHTSFNLTFPNQVTFPPSFHQGPSPGSLGIVSHLSSKWLLTVRTFSGSPAYWVADRLKGAVLWSGEASASRLNGAVLWGGEASASRLKGAVL